MPLTSRHVFDGDHEYLPPIVAIDPEAIDVVSVIPRRASTHAVGPELDRSIALAPRLALDSYELPLLLIGKVIAPVTAEWKEDVLASTREGSENGGFGPFADL